jgi:hypothetical protein
MIRRMRIARVVGSSLLRIAIVVGTTLVAAVVTYAVTGWLIVFVWWFLVSLLAVLAVPFVVLRSSVGDQVGRAGVMLEHWGKRRSFKGDSMAGRGEPAGLPSRWPRRATDTQVDGPSVRRPQRERRSIR